MSVNGSNNFLNIEDANLRVRNGSVHAQGMTIGGAIVSASHGLQSVSDTSNTTSNTLQFTNATTAFKATSNIELTSASKIIVESNVLMDFKTLGQIEFPGSTVEQEYPPGPMSANESVIAGHGIFKARSSTNSSPNLDRQPWNAFDDDLNYGFDSYHGTPDYDTNGNYTANTGVTLLSGGGTYLGEFLEIELPYPIKLRTNQLYPQQSDGTTYLSTYGIPRFFREALILGSNDGLLWNTLQSISETSYSFASEFNEYITVDTNSQTYYKYFRVAVNKVIGGTAGNRLDIYEWKLFGTPGPTTLDKGSLTLGRSLDVPRVSRYDVDTETPRPEKLVVDFDTTVNESPTDISGKGNHGAYRNDSEYSATDKAFKFAAANAHIYLEQGTISGTSATHTFSLWINALSGPGNGSYEAIFEGGVRSNHQAFGLYAYQDGSNTRVYYHVFGNNLPSNTAGYIVNTNSWYHICGTLDNSGNVRRFYVNGELFASDTYGSLNVTHPRIRIGENVNGSESWHGMVSNFKLYSVALEASEVQKLYRLGRTGRSMVISDTAVGIGKVPEAQLDVRGTISFTEDSFEIYKTLAASWAASAGFPNQATDPWGGAQWIWRTDGQSGGTDFKYIVPRNGILMVNVTMIHRITQFRTNSSTHATYWCLRKSTDDGSSWGTSLTAEVIGHRWVSGSNQEWHPVCISYTGRVNKGDQIALFVKTEYNQVGSTLYGTMNVEECRMNGILI